jgi:hypothetical protein
MKASKTLYPILLALSAIVLLGVVGALDKQRLEEEQRQYCQMHELWIKSGGELGWPDYNGNYAEVCK